MAASKPVEQYSESQELKSDVRAVMAEQIRTTEKLSNMVLALQTLTEKFDGVTAQLARQQTLVELQAADAERNRKAIEDTKTSLVNLEKDLRAKDASQDRFIWLAMGGLTVVSALAPIFLKLIGIIQ